MSADDYPGPDGEALRRQRLPGAAERWESLPWENRMALLGGLAEEAAQHQREADFAASTAMRERFAALAVTYETAHAVLMRADTVSSKDKSQEEVAAERSEYETPRTPEMTLVEVIRSIESVAEKADALATRKGNQGLDMQRHKARGRAEGLREAIRMLKNGG